jgi:LPS sulfotransferase NodH
MEEALCEQMKALSALPDSAPPSKKLLILSSQRCGSSLFCNRLNNLNLVGNTLEWFNSPYINAYAKVNNISNVDFNKYFDFILKKTVNDTGVFSVNVHIENFKWLLSNKLNILQMNFDCIVYLERKDKLDQAISLTLAEKTGVWSSNLKATNTLTTPPTNAEITTQLYKIFDFQEYFEQYLQSVTQYHFYYEDFKSVNVQDYAQIFDELGLDNISLDEIKQVLERDKVALKTQSSSINSELKKQFMQKLLDKPNETISENE